MQRLISRRNAVAGLSSVRLPSVERPAVCGGRGMARRGPGRVATGALSAARAEGRVTVAAFPFA